MECVRSLIVFVFLSFSADIVAYDNMGCGDSPAPNQPELYTEQEVSETKALSLCSGKFKSNMSLSL